MKFRLIITLIVVALPAFGYFLWTAFGGTITNLTLTTNPDLESGLVGHWTFDGPDLLQNAMDKSGSGNTAYLQGFTATTTTPGKIGQALEFDGSNDVVDVLDSSELRLSDGEFTLSAWVYIASTTAQGRAILSKRDASPAVKWSLNIDSVPRFNFVMANPAFQTITDSPTRNLNQWYHVTATYIDADDSLKLYVDGQLSLDASYTESIDATNNAMLNIGFEDTGNSTRFWDGKLDDIRIYNRALSAREVKRLHKLGDTTHINLSLTTNPDLETGLVGHWTFDGKDMGENLVDRSGNGNTGYLVNFTATTTGLGRIGQALQFDGTDDYASTTVSDTVRSVAFWVKPDSTTESVIDFPSAGGTATAFPQVESITTTSFSSAVTTHNVRMPETVNADDLLIMFFSAHKVNTAFTITNPSGWDVQYNQVYSPDSLNQGVAAYVVSATGDEDGAVVDVATSETTTGAAQVYRITSWEGSTSTIESVRATQETDTTADPPSLTPAFGSANYLWIAGAHGQDDDALISSYSTDYTNGTNTASGAGTNAAAEIATARREAAGTSEDPGTITWAEVERHVAFTLNVAPGTAGSSDSSTASIEISSGVATSSGFVSQTVYVDGVNDNSFPDTGWHHVVVTDATGFSVGDLHAGRIGDTYFNGSIDDVRVYDRELSANDVKRLYDLGATTHVNVSLNTNPDLDSGLVGHWTFDGKDVTADDILDRSGQGNHGDFVGGATTSAAVVGKIGQGFQLDGTNDYVDVSGSLISTLAGISTFSVSLWAKADNNQTTGAGFSIRQNDNQSSTLFIIYPYDTNGGNGVRIWFNSASLIDENGVNRADGKWHHFLFVSRSATDHQIFVDGKSAGTSASSKTLPDPLTGVNIGRWYGTTQMFKGSVDDVRIYDRALSATEIKRLYEFGR